MKNRVFKKGGGGRMVKGGLFVLQNTWVRIGQDTGSTEKEVCLQQ